MRSFKLDECCSGQNPREGVSPGGHQHGDTYKIRKKRRPKKWKPEPGWQKPQLLSWTAQDSNTSQQRAGDSSHRGKSKQGPIQDEGEC